MPYSSHHFCPPPLQYTAARNDMPLPGKEDIRRPQCRRRRRQEEHMDRAPSSSCVSPRGMYLPQKKKKRPSDDTRRSSFTQGRAKRENSACSKRQAGIHTRRATTKPPVPPPPVSCGIRACLVCNCTSPLARSSRPPHTQISGDSTAPSAPVDHPRTFVPGPCSGPGSMGMGWPKREGFETSIPLEQEGRTETRA